MSYERRPSSPGGAPQRSLVARSGSTNANSAARLSTSWPLVTTRSSWLLRTASRLPASSTFFRGFLSGGSWDRIEPIFVAFAAGDKFHHRGETHYRELRRLREIGWVEQVGRGYWSPSVEIARTFEFLRYGSTAAVRGQRRGERLLGESGWVDGIIADPEGRIVVG